MVGTNLKAEALNLMERRSNLEAEMDVIIQRLCQPGGPGLSGNLVDSEAIHSLCLSQSGFPRSDIDIPVVRADRHRLAELRNDHKDVTEKISQNIEALHSSKVTRASAPVRGTGRLIYVLLTWLHMSVLKPPCYVLCLHIRFWSRLWEESCAFEGVNNEGMFANVGASAVSAMEVDVTVNRPFAMVDEITEASPAAEDGLQLGDQIVKFGNVESGEDLLPKLSVEAQTNQGRSVPMVVMRQGAFINLTVTPRAWDGRGLLGYI
ncbi:hypothetical protein RJ639_002827 [Escallonia herrerae]|uniref:PDZ domain-containing protein n=1 Tax=Escallonia herrerae TaxID=1293975 RepID=A0AA88W2B4_9ASTE|nr:hypothetical protein RJ639_002827 [Escallonia herrerae]